MKKFIIAATAVAFIGIGGSSALAQTEQAPDPTVLPGVSVPLPIECSERDNGAPDTDGDGIPDVCVDFYVEEEVQPPTTSTTTTTVVDSAAPLPETGSTVSPLLGIGALLLVGGGIVVVATRRRSTATAS